MNPLGYDHTHPSPAQKKREKQLKKHKATCAKKRAIRKRKKRR